MQLTMARTPSLRPILAIVLVALLTLALVATALYIGSPRQLPAPFGLARNGAVVYSEGSDLYIANELTAETRALLAGPEDDSSPVFTNQGDRIAFVRQEDGAFQVMTVLPDGSNVTSLGSVPGGLDRLAWSPDGTKLLVGHTATDYTGLRVAVVNADGSGVQELDLGGTADYASWRPDGRQIVFRGHDLAAGNSSAFIADADGTNIRRLDIPTTQDVDFEGLGWSPDGKHLSFMSSGDLGAVKGWQLNIADIDADGSVTKLHRLRLDPDSTGEHLPVWSPDSSQVAFLQQKDFKRQVGIFNADGSDYRLVGPEVSDLRILGYTWSPDGKTLVITEVPEQEARREIERRMWSVDVATGEQAEIQVPVGSWQRLAP